MSDANSPQRYTETEPCPICGGWENHKRGSGDRCHGYLSSHNPKLAFCSQVPNGDEASGVYKHRTAGKCGCGSEHQLNHDREQAPRKKVRRKKVNRKKVNRKKVNRKKVNRKKVNRKKVNRKKVNRKKVNRKKVNRKKVNRKKVKRKTMKTSTAKGDKAKRAGRQEPEDGYVYHDPEGNAVYAVIRLQPKGFRQARIDPDGTWESKKGCMKGVTLYPYKLPSVIEAVAEGQAIWITEGEADADAIVGVDEVATTNSGGSGKWEDDYSLYLVGAQKVVLWPDWDEKGRLHMEQVYKSIKSASPKTKIEIVRSANDLKDARDHFEAGYSLDDVVAVELPELAPHEAFIDELNEKYAVAAVGSSTVILHEYWDPGFKRIMVEFMSPSSLNLMYRHRQVGNWSIASLWLRHPHRRTYDRVVFYPGETDERYYNLWRGFSVEPCAGKCSRFLSHVKKNICSGDDERYRWLMSWMAQAVQNPEDRPGTAVVLRGAQGVGKGVFAQAFGSLFGSHFLQVAQVRHLVGHFNAHLKDCLILWGDEAYWAGDKPNAGALRALVTEPYIVLEMKGRDAVRLPNLIRLIMSSNDDWAVPAALDERRFAVFDVSDRRKQDRRYFAKIQEELDNGGREALLHHLMHYDYSKVDVGRIPSSAALGEQKIFSMHPVDQWWLQRLEEGRLDEGRIQIGRLGSIDDGWNRCVTTNDLYEDYVEFSKNAGRFRRETVTEFGIYLRKLVPELKKSRRSLNGRRAYFYEFPSLKKCRKAFEARLGTKYEWPEDDADLKGPQSALATVRRRKRKPVRRKKIKRKAG